MAYYTEEELKKLNFKFIGRNVKISDKASIYDHSMISIDDNSRIDDFCVVSGNITIGKNVHIAPFVLLAGGEKGIHLHDFSGCAYSVKIFSQSDDYSGLTLTNPTIPSKFKKERKRKVIIGKHVIIGTSSIVFPGVEIKEGCSIGAMSSVMRSTKEWGVYSGIPATRIKERKKDLIDLEIKYLEESEK